MAMQFTISLICHISVCIHSTWCFNFPFFLGQFKTLRQHPFGYLWLGYGFFLEKNLSPVFGKKKNNLFLTLRKKNLVSPSAATVCNAKSKKIVFDLSAKNKFVREKNS